MVVAHAARGWLVGRLELDDQIVGVEIDRTDRPRMTPSTRDALDDLGLDLVVAHARARPVELAERVVAVPAIDLLGSTDVLPGLLSTR